MSEPIYLYFARHGETLFNLKSYAQGWCDSPLTEDGITSARNLGKGFKKDNILFDAIYTSPFTRAYETTEYICEEMQSNVPIKRDSLLKEVNFGIWEGELNIVRFKAMGLAPFNENITYPEGECHDGLYARTEAFLEKVIQNQEHRNILVVTHGVWMMTFLTRKFGWDVHSSGGISNASVTKIKYQDGTFETIIIGDKSYQE